MTLHMLSFHPNMERLMRLATRKRLLPPGGDLGYAVHTVFVNTFGQLAPKPFAYLAPGTPGGGGGRLLAYSSYSLNELRDQAALFADPDDLASLDIETSAGNAMRKGLEPGTRLGFRLRVWPVVRTGKANAKGDGGETKAKERDVYLAALATAPDQREVDRGRVYAEWLAAQLRLNGAELERATLDAFSRTSVMRRDRSGGNGEAKKRWFEGPDATLLGALAVRDPAAFALGLARGIGRHRAFGFGMVLLAPPQ